MKVAISIAVAVIMPFGFFVLAGVIISRILARRKQRQTVNAERTGFIPLAATSSHRHLPIVFVASITDTKFFLTKCFWERGLLPRVSTIRLQRRIATMTDQKDALKAEVMRPIGPPTVGEVTWYRNADGNYTVAAVVVGIICIFVAIYIVH